MAASVAKILMILIINAIVYNRTSMKKPRCWHSVFTMLVVAIHAASRVKSLGLGFHYSRERCDFSTRNMQVPMIVTAESSSHTARSLTSSITNIRNF